MRVNPGFTFFSPKKRNFRPKWEKIVICILLHYQKKMKKSHLLHFFLHISPFRYSFPGHLHRQTRKIVVLPGNVILRLSAQDSPILEAPKTSMRTGATRRERAPWPAPPGPGWRSGRPSGCSPAPSGPPCPPPGGRQGAARGDQHRHRGRFAPLPLPYLCVSYVVWSPPPPLFS